MPFPVAHTNTKSAYDKPARPAERAFDLRLT
jgi:hypothetical protein